MELTRKDVKTRSTADLWAALDAAAPEMTAVVRNSPDLPRFHYRDYDGFREWLILELALNTPGRLIRDKLRVIRDDQEAEGVDALWPQLSKSQIDNARRVLAPEWQPIRAKVEEQIAQVGIANKVARLMAYQQMADEISDRMWDERNDKTGQLYLLREFRETIRAVAEEMGDLGKPAEDEREGLVEIAKELLGMVKVQGMGLQDANVVDATFDYETGEYRVED